MPRTLTKPVVISGIGLFSGADTEATFAPGAPGSGYTARVNNHAFPLTISHLCKAPAHPAFAGIPPRSTNLAHDPNADRPEFITAEHALSALAGLGLADIEVALTGSETPIGDGSAIHFVEALKDAPSAECAGPEPFVVTEPFRVTDNQGNTLLCEPADKPEYVYTLDYGDAHPLLRKQTARWTPGDRDHYLTDVAPARTFSLQNEVEQMRSLGLFARFTPADLLVLGPDGPIDNALRFQDEPARHKLLDLIGDLALLFGRPIVGRISAERTGHAHTHDLVRALAQQARHI
ncbi:MAG: UDP-3-O-acyl-N-acetylglucosamine deacetylase [Planctomycetota bacterium]